MRDLPMTASSFVQSLAGSAPVRRIADALLRRYARRPLQALDRLPAARIQQETLLRLVRHSRHTRFGRDHDFARIRTVEDYQRCVPLRDYEAFWQGYWQPAFPCLRDVTWPGSIPYFALSSGTTSGSTKYIPVSAAMVASNRQASLTTL